MKATKFKIHFLRNILLKFQINFLKGITSRNVYQQSHAVRQPLVRVSIMSFHVHTYITKINCLDSMITEFTHLTVEQLQREIHFCRSFKILVLLGHDTLVFEYHWIEWKERISFTRLIPEFQYLVRFSSYKEKIETN